MTLDNMHFKVITNTPQRNQLLLNKLGFDISGIIDIDKICVVQVFYGKIHAIFTMDYFDQITGDEVTFKQAMELLSHLSTTSEEKYRNYIDNHIKMVKMVWGAIRNKIIWSCKNTLSKLDIRIANHDNGKYDDIEFGGYKGKFYPDGSKLYTDGEIEEIDIAFKQAWNHHQKSNDHHWEWWIMFDKFDSPIWSGTPLEMSFDAIIEMLCDWTAMSLKNQNIPSEWFADNRKNMLIHPSTIKIIECHIPAFDFIYDKLKGRI